MARSLPYAADGLEVASGRRGRYHRGGDFLGVV